MITSTRGRQSNEILNRDVVKGGSRAIRGNASVHMTRRKGRERNKLCSGAGTERCIGNTKTVKVMLIMLDYLRLPMIDSAIDFVSV